MAWCAKAAPASSLCAAALLQPHRSVRPFQWRWQQRWQSASCRLISATDGGNGSNGSRLIVLHRVSLNIWGNAAAAGGAFDQGEDDSFPVEDEVEDQEPAAEEHKGPLVDSNDTSAVCVVVLMCACRTSVLQCQAFGTDGCCAAVQLRTSRP